MVARDEESIQITNDQAVLDQVEVPNTESPSQNILPSEADKEANSALRQTFGKT